MRAGTHQLCTLTGHQDYIYCLTVKDGMLFSGSNDTTIKIWDIARSKELHTVNRQQSFVTCLTLKDGMLFSSSDDKTIKIWDFNPANNCIKR